MLSFVPEPQTEIRDICLVDVVPFRTLLPVLPADPVLQWAFACVLYKVV